MTLKPHISSEEALESSFKKMLLRTCSEHFNTSLRLKISTAGHQGHSGHARSRASKPQV